MIYKLPTKGRPYRGKFPERLRSVSAANGAVHLELNNGTRYIAGYKEFSGLPDCSRPMADFVAGPVRTLALTAPMYNDLLAASRDVSPNARRVLLAKWDAAFAAQVL